MASRYKKYMRLLEAWPSNKAKGKDDLGQHIRQKIADAFSRGESSTISDPDKCDRMYASLHRISSDHYRKKYQSTVKLQGATLYSKQKLNEYLTEEGLDEIRKRQRGFFGTLMDMIFNKKNK